MQRVVQLVVNPTAGSSSRKRLRALRQAFEAAEVRLIVTQTGAGKVAIADDADHVCVVGGDGTLRHVAMAVHATGRPLPISIYPTGTINLVARECSYPRDPAAFVARVLGAAPSRRHHFATIGQVMLVGVGSVGPDSLAVAHVSTRLKHLIGRAAYVMAFLKTLSRWPRPQLRLRADGQDIACEAVYVAKGRFYAGPWSFAPEAAVDSPLLHVVALRRATRRDFMRFVWALWRGRNGEDPNLVRFTCTDLAIDGAATLPLQADGDIVAHLPARIILHSDTLSFA